MNAKRQTAVFSAGVAVAAALVAMPARAEIPHYVPGLMNIRDFLVPADPGFYGVLYNYYYKTERINDRDGDKIRSINVNPGPGPGLDVDVDVDIDLYALAPAIIWVSEWKILGAKFAAYAAPTFANVSINAQIGNQNALGRDAGTETFSLGDMFVQPLWLGWNGAHFDGALGYGFYAPTGDYDTKSVSAPTGATVRVESPDNIGYGYWTHQFQGAGAWYPWEDRRMAAVLVGTYEINHEKEDYDLTSGNDFTLNWGVSQYLPLKKDHTLLAELGIAGYDQWQTTEDTGSDSRGGEDNAHAAGSRSDSPTCRGPRCSTFTTSTSSRPTRVSRAT
jgi:hypothetical protein